MTQADKILTGMLPLHTWAQRVACAQRIIAETGDLPEAIWYQLWFGQVAVPSDIAAESLLLLRPKGAKPYVGGWR